MYHGINSTPRSEAEIPRTQAKALKMNYHINNKLILINTSITDELR